MLAVPNEAALRIVQRKLATAGIAHVPIVEVDPPYENQLCAIGLAPVADRAPIKKQLGSLPLLK